MTFDNEKKPDLSGQKPIPPNSLTQKLDLMRQLAAQSDQNPGLATSEQSSKLNLDIVETLKQVRANGGYSQSDTLATLAQLMQRSSNQLDALESRLNTYELKRNQRRN